MKYTLMQSALRELHAIFTAPVRLAAMATAIILLAISGPFGTLEYDVPTRVLYWLVVVVATYAVGQVTGTLADRRLAQRMTPPMRIVPVALIVSLPTSLIVFAATWLAEPETVPHPLTLWFYVFIVSLALVMAIVLLELRAASDEPVAAVATAPALLQRLPLPQRGRLMHIAVADHYVEVATDKGKTLLLMRLSDAIGETAPTSGLQVHRSHWVALDAVKRGARLSGKPMLELENGTLVPVSRSYQAAAKAAGLLA